MQNTRALFHAFAPTGRLRIVPADFQRVATEKLAAFAGEIELAGCWLVANVSIALLPYRPLAFPAALCGLVGLAAGYLIGLVK